MGFAVGVLLRSDSVVVGELQPGVAARLVAAPVPTRRPLDDGRPRPVPAEDDDVAGLGRVSVRVEVPQLAEYRVVGVGPVPADDGRFVTVGSYLAHTGFEFVPRLGLFQHRLGGVDRLGGQAGQLLGLYVAVGQAADLVGVVDGDVARPYLLLHFGG